MSLSRRKAIVELFRSAPHLVQVHKALPPAPEGMACAWRFEPEDAGRAARPDGVITRRCVRSGHPDLAVVLEVVLERDEQRRRNWPRFVHDAEVAFGCRTELFALCPEQEVAAWAAEACLSRAGVAGLTEGDG